VAAFLAPLAKEVGWALPIVLFLWWRAGLLPERPPETARRIVVASFLGSFLTVIYRLLTIGGLGDYPDTLARLKVGVSSLPSLLLHATLLPANPSFGAWSTAINTACATAAVALVLACVAGRKRKQPGARLVAGGLAVAVATLLPALPYLSAGAYWQNSRYLTLPGIGLALASAGCAVSAGTLGRTTRLALAGSWLAALILATIPWLQAAGARDLLLGAIEIATRPPGVHQVWVQGPIGELNGAHLFGAHLVSAVDLRFPDRTIETSSSWSQRRSGERPRPPCASSGPHCHLLRFRSHPPRVTALSSFPARGCASQQ